METIVLDNQEDAIDFIAENNEMCKGRKIFIDPTMFNKIKKLADNVKQSSKNFMLEIVCPETKNLTQVEIIREGSNCYWLKDVKAEDIEPISPVDKTKNALRIINNRTFKKEEEIYHNNLTDAKPREK